MHVLVLGSGVIGTTLSYYLAQKGLKVTVIDRQEGPALEASFANAGQISPGYASPWAAPGIPFKAVKWLLQKHAPLAIHGTASLRQYKWMMQLVGNCTSAKYAINKSRMVRLSEYSRDCLVALRADTGITYEERLLGTTQLLRTPEQMRAIHSDIRILEKFNVPYELLDQEGIMRVEPALKRVVHKLAGGLRLPNDETGDCYLFTQKIYQMAQALGVEFKFKATVEQLMFENNIIKGAIVDGELLEADQYALCLGSYSTEFLAPLGLPIPVYPLKGYSLTIPIESPNDSPVSTILDETYKIAITRFDKRIRVGGMAEICGFDLRLEARRRATIEYVTNDLFPKGGDTTQGTFWAGLRPATPDGTPIVGKTRFDNLFLNTGHGTLGWTMAAGCGRYLADIMTDQPPEISTEGLDLSRYD